MPFNFSELKEKASRGIEEGKKAYKKYEESKNETTNTDPSIVDPRAVATIPAEVRMISGCKDQQTSADVSDVSTFELPDPAGMSGGACTSAFLQVVYKDHQDTSKTLSFQQVLMEMRKILKSKRYSQIPQLSSSRPLDVHEQFAIVPENFNGTRRAVIIGINYVGQKGELRGCHNDAKNMKEYLMDIHKFPERNISMLLDDGYERNPTRSNIIAAFKNLVSQSSPGDACFVHYSGHGGRLKDDNGDEADGYDETLIPVDFLSAGQIRDDELFVTLVGAMSSGVTLTCLMDCCHSGSILDLPYVFKADGQSNEMSMEEGFNFNELMELASMIKNIKDIGDLMEAGLKLKDIYKEGKKYFKKE